MVLVIEACEQLLVDLDVVHGVPHEEAVERFKRADIVVDQMHYPVRRLRDRVDGVREAGGDAARRDGLSARRRKRSGSRPIVSAKPDMLVEKLPPAAESFEERRRRGEAGRAYVEQVHDIDKLSPTG